MVLPMPHMASSTSDGFDQDGELNHSGPRCRPCQQRVHRADAGLEEVDEREHAGHRRDERRQVEDRAVEGRAAAHLGEQRGAAEPGQDLGRHHDHDEPQRVPRRGAHERVVQQVACSCPGRTRCRGRPGCRTCAATSSIAVTSGKTRKIAMPSSAGAMNDSTVRWWRSGAPPARPGAARRAGAVRRRPTRSGWHRVGRLGLPS